MQLNEEAEKAARKFAVKNAIDYGKAQPGAVISKLLGIYPELKENMKDVSKEVGAIVKEVNGLGKNDLEKAYAPFRKEFEEREIKRAEETSKPRMILEGVQEGNFATRYAPEPNGYLHIGHAMNIFLGQEFAKMYKGKAFLYFDDTNPEKEKQDYVDAIKKDLEWLGAKFDQEYYASDSIEKVYDYARKLIAKGGAYACMCDDATRKENRLHGIACGHRETPADDNLKIFEDMIRGKYGEKEVAIRFKGDMKASNTTMRDPTIFRIKESEHYRQGNKYRAWPTYDFNTPIQDSIHGVTDAFRSKEYELRDYLYSAILEALDLRIPRIHPYARLAIKDNMTSKRQIVPLINEHILKGFDDPRLVTLSGLRNRGVSAEAIRNFVLRFGTGKSERKIDIGMLLSENRKIIDRTSKRLFFVKEPVRLEIGSMTEEQKMVKLRLHPTEDLGYKEYTLSNIFYISGEDANAIENSSVVLLKDLYRVRITKAGNVIKGEIVNSSENVPVIQWVNEGNYAQGTIKQIEPLLKNNELNPDSMKDVPGYIEKYVDKLKDGETVNLERMGFYKLDSKQERIFFSL